MRMTKNLLFMSLGAMTVLAYQNYGGALLESVESMMDSKIKFMNKIDNELEDML